MTPAQLKAAAWFNHEITLLKAEAAESKGRSHGRKIVPVSRRSHHIPTSGAIGIILAKKGPYAVRHRQLRKNLRPTRGREKDREELGLK